MLLKPKYCQIITVMTTCFMKSRQAERPLTFHCSPINNQNFNYRQGKYVVPRTPGNN